MERSIQISHSDTTDEVYATAIEVGCIAIDIETTGLDWSNDVICTVQIYIPNSIVQIIRPTTDAIPHTLRKIIADPFIRKIFHFAAFDLRFMRNKWDVHPENIVCTKVLSKVLHRDSDSSHSLKHLLKDYLGISISKQMRLSDWTLETLSEEQLRYACDDVLYLPQLFSTLWIKAISEGQSDVAKDLFNKIPVVIELECGDLDNIFRY